MLLLLLLLLLRCFKFLFNLQFSVLVISEWVAYYTILYLTIYGRAISAYQALGLVSKGFSLVKPFETAADKFLQAQCPSSQPTNSIKQHCVKTVYMTVAVHYLLWTQCHCHLQHWRPQHCHCLVTSSCAVHSPTPSTLPQIARCPHQHTSAGPEAAGHHQHPVSDHHHHLHITTKTTVL